MEKGLRWIHKILNIEKLKKILKERDIILECGFKGTIEESELAYKDIKEVIETAEKSKLGKRLSS